MCNLPNRDAELKLMQMGITLIDMAMKVTMKVNNQSPSVDLLSSATQAYQEGKITKRQFISVINALDEPTSDPNDSINREKLKAALLNQPW